MRRSVALLGVLLLAAACRHRVSEPIPGDAPVEVVVHDDYGLPMEVYVAGNATTFRLGIVHPGTSSRFRIPPAILRTGSVELLARASATETARSGPQLLFPGTIVDFYITPRLFNSYAEVRQ